MKNVLTEQKYWDETWRELELPAEVKRVKKSNFPNELLDIFDDMLPHDASMSILEIGGAPGQYLAFFAKKFNYKIAALDYSEIGCKKMKINFKLLGINGKVYHKDLFNNKNNIPLFDIVYSLGFIEHFTNLREVIEKHLELLKPDGILIIGSPNLQGINSIILNRIAPELMSRHNITATNTDNWQEFKQQFRLATIYEGYIGGFEPGRLIYRMSRKQKVFNQLIVLFFQGCNIIMRNLKLLRVLNSKYWSSYVVGIYRKP